MVEPIHCPACSTRYALRPGRLRPAHRRAQCFRCGGIFPLTADVRRTLGALEAEAPALEVNPFAAVDFDEVPDLPAASPFADEPVERLSAAPALAAPELPVMPDTLTLGDLEGTEEEIFEKTLYVPSSDPQPETRAAAEEPAPELPAAPLTASGFSSARDAISKLLSGAPAPMPAPMASSGPGTLGVEETLSALEATLGGVQPSQLSADAVTLPGEAPSAPQDAPTPATPLSQAAPGSTMRLSRAELLAAMATTAEEASAPTMETSLAALTAGVLPTPAPVPSSAETQPTSAAADDPNLLRLKVGEEIYPALSMDQLVQWVEEGRVLESHQVARQFSENWLEAGKVPALRPVFERVRRAKGQEIIQAAPVPDSITPPKKGLFSGLFGRKDS